MNPNILKSLKHLELLSKVKTLPYKTPNWHTIPKLVFYCLNTEEITDSLPEEAFFADFEYQCNHEGSITLPGFDPVQKKKPFCGQFIGLSGKSYVWFGDGEALCSVGDTATTFIVHNITADRPMILESWNPNTNLGPNFFCTMSAHLLLAGISGQQDWSYKAGDLGPRAGGLKNLIDVFNFWSAESYPEVMNRFATRGKARIAEKEIREIFYKGTSKEIAARLPELMTYGFEDVDKLVKLFPSMYDCWLEQLPMLESQYFYFKRAKVNYSLDSDFRTWFENTELKYQTELKLIDTKVRELTDSIVIGFTNEIDKVISSNPIEPPQECFTKSSKYTKLKAKYNNTYVLHKEFNPKLSFVVEKYSDEYPCINWELTNKGLPVWADKPISSRSVDMQLLLKPKFRDTVNTQVQVKYARACGFYYEKDGVRVKITSPKKGLNTKDNCGSLFSKDFISYWESGVLSTDSGKSNEIVSVMASISYWTSVRSRLAEIYCSVL